MIPVWQFPLLSGDSFTITLGRLLLGLLFFAILSRLIRRLFRESRLPRFFAFVKDREIRSWLVNFASFLFIVIITIFTLSIIGIPLTILGNIWNLTLFSVKDSSVELGNILLGLILLYPGLKFSRYLSNEFQSIFLKHLNLETATKKSLELVFRYLLVILVVLFVLTIVGVPLTAFTLIGGAVAIGVGLGSQNLVNNFLSGIVLMTERPLKIDDVVEIEGRQGIVEFIGGRSTRIRTFDNVRMVIPNSKLLENTVINWSLMDTDLRREVTVGVAYGSPTEETRDLILDAVRSHAQIKSKPKPLVLFRDFGDNALIFTVYFWVELTESIKPLIVESDIRYAIEKRFREAGIEIAFPQRDIHLDTVRPLEIRMSDSPAPKDKS
ncbi:MAG: mechanosensitive ion channel [FCB group bacterium]|nr:mechanosensitive ion channel [FCB group bacterium]